MTGRIGRGGGSYRAVSALSFVAAALLLGAASWVVSRPPPRPRLELRAPARGIDAAPPLAVLTAPASSSSRCASFSKGISASAVRALPSGPVKLGPFAVRLGRDVIGLRAAGGEELLIPSSAAELDAAASLTLRQHDERDDSYLLVLAGATGAPAERVWKVAQLPAWWWGPAGLALTASVVLCLAWRSLRRARAWFRPRGMSTWQEGRVERGLVYAASGEVIGRSTCDEGPVLHGAAPAAVAAAGYRGGLREHVVLHGCAAGTWEQNRKTHASSLARAASLLTLSLVLGAAGLTAALRADAHAAAPDAKNSFDAVAAAPAPGDGGERSVLGIIRSNAWHLDALDFSKDGTHAGYVVDDVVGTTEGACSHFAHASSWSPVIWSDPGGSFAFFAGQGSQRVTLFDGATEREVPSDGFAVAFMPGSDERVMTTGSSLCVGTHPCNVLPIDPPSGLHLSRDGTRALVTSGRDEREKTYAVEGLGAAEPTARELPAAHAATFGGDHEIAYATRDPSGSCHVHRERKKRPYGPYEACRAILFSGDGRLVGYLAKQGGGWKLFVDGDPMPGPASEASELHMTGAATFGVHVPGPFELSEVAWHEQRVARYRPGVEVTEPAVVISGTVRRDHSQIAPRTVRFSEDGRFLLFGAADRTEQGWVISWNRVPLGDETIRTVHVGFDVEEPATRRARSDLEPSCAGLRSRTTIRDAEVVGDQVTVTGSFTNLDPRARCGPAPWEAWVETGSDRHALPLRFDIDRRWQASPQHESGRTVQLTLPPGAVDFSLRVGTRERRIDLGR